ncbi:ATP-binding cassette domain-containing protein [Caldanaerobacter sp.]|uniref:ATP-binding cassette domain-containing protein n=1 Tax=Caldanaerobacter sp. TaxID=2930036 RepID=UPI003C7875F6
MKKYFFKNKLLFTGNIILTLAESILSVMLAFILANFVDAAVEYDMALLYKTCIIFSLYLISVLIVWYSLRIVRASYIRQMLFDLKNDIFSRVINKEIDQFQKGNSASYISTLNNDITILEQDYFKNILTMVALIFSFIIATVAIFKLNFFIAVGVFVISIFLVAIPYFFREKISRAKGSNLSGGERQRISIARALIKGTPILVSDEPTSSLDKKTALSIENSILSIGGLTALVITHNTSEEVPKKYDKIIFVEDGEIVKVGAFDEIFTPASVVLSIVG